MKLRRIVALAAAVAALAALTACSDPEPREPDWSAYAPAVEARVKAAVKAGDCEAMQFEFDVASGHPNSAELLSYLDDAMRRVGCYE